MELHLTQSALSVLVRELETEVGVRLFDRHTRRVVLSQAGQEFQPAVQRMLADLSAAVDGMAELRDKKRGVLRLAAPQLMACTLMPRVIAAYRSLFPDVDVRLADTLPEHLRDGIASSDVELAIGPDIDVDETLTRRPLFKGRHWLVCPPGHALASRRSMAWHGVISHRRRSSRPRVTSCGGRSPNSMHPPATRCPARRRGRCRTSPLRSA